MKRMKVSPSASKPWLSTNVSSGSSSPRATSLPLAQYINMSGSRRKEKSYLIIGWRMLKWLCCANAEISGMNGRKASGCARFVTSRWTAEWISVELETMENIAFTVIIFDLISDTIVDMLSNTIRVHQCNYLHSSKGSTYPVGTNFVALVWSCLFHLTGVLLFLCLVHLLERNVGDIKYAPRLLYLNSPIGHYATNSNALVPVCTRGSQRRRIQCWIGHLALERRAVRGLLGCQLLKDR